MYNLETHREFGRWIMRVFRWDLQLHFFWGFILTLLGEYWFPLTLSGVIATLIKEALDLWSKQEWSWGDFWGGMAGCGVAFLHMSHGQS